MKILLCHNYYRLPGGEDIVYRDEGWLLERFGHEVVRYERHNQSIDSLGALDLARTTIWSRDAYEEIGEMARAHRPDIVHFHNTFPLISASGYYAVHRAGLPVVQTLHNYRTICPGSTLLRKGQICEKCIRMSFAWPSVMHNCYRGSRKATLVTAVSNAVHHLRGTWHKCVDRYIALTNHSRDRFISSGIDQRKISVKPNFVRPDPGVIASDRRYAVFVSRLSTEKGVETLLAAWKLLGSRIPLRIVGDGPLREIVLQAQDQDPAVSWLGQLPFEQVLQEIGHARVLVCPSIWYETFGRSIIEAFATGTPVIASDIGSMKELVGNERNGLHFRVGDPHDLADKVARFFDDQSLFHESCRAARTDFEEKFSADKNYETLMNIYEQAIAERDRRTGSSR